MKKLFLATGLILLFFSCSSPMDKNFNEQTSGEDLKEIKEDIDSTEFMLLAGNLIRLKLQDKNIESMTYAEILENGKDYKAEQSRLEAEQKALAETALKKDKERIARLNEAVVVTCFEKGYAEANYQEYLTYVFAIQNKSNKAVRAVKGDIYFNDLFDEEITSLSFTYDQPIPVGETVNWNASSSYNQFKASDSKFKNKDLKDIKVVWKPEKIIFEDGSTLE